MVVVVVELVAVIALEPHTFFSFFSATFLTLDALAPARQSSHHAVQLLVTSALP